MKTLDLILKCNGCNKDNYLHLQKNKPTIYKCKHCNKEIFNFKPLVGYIYVLKNSAFPKLLKIGFTRRTVAERVAELNAPTGVPGKFEIVAFYASEIPEFHEQNIHAELSKYRDSKEFFKTDVNHVLNTIESICGRTPFFVSKNVHLENDKNEGTDKSANSKKKDISGKNPTAPFNYKRMRAWQEKMYKK